MALFKKDTSQLQTQQNDTHKALKARYLTPGIQRDLRDKENVAVQTVLEVLERRRAAAHKTVHLDKLSAARKPISDHTYRPLYFGPVGSVAVRGRVPRSADPSRISHD
jgi:hypothetical protein